MLRRSIWAISSRKPLRRIQSAFQNQIPSYLSTRKDFSSASQLKSAPKPVSTGKPPASGSSGTKKVIAGVAIGAAFLAAYATGSLDEIIDKGRQSSIEKEVKGLEERLASVDSEKKVSNKTSPDIEIVEQKVEAHSDTLPVEGFSEEQSESQPNMQEKLDAVHEDHLNDSRSSMVSGVTPDEKIVPAHEKDLLKDSHSGITTDVRAEGGTVDAKEKDSNSSMISGDQTDSGLSLKRNVDLDIPEESTKMKQNEMLQVPPISTQTSNVPEEQRKQTILSQNPSAEDKSESAVGKDTEEPRPLLDEYYLDEPDKSATALNRESTDEYKDIPKGEEALVNALEEVEGGSIKLIEAIHAAEKMQAEFDTRVFTEEKRALKEKYEQELKDAIAREFMRAEEAAILDKELKRERAKAAAAIKSIQEKMEQKLKMELEQKEKEAEMKLKKVQDLGKAELAAAIAREKQAQIEKIAEANLNINALCMAFYARSEEAQQTHSIHKLALGVLALEEALSNGLPVRAELQALQNYIETIDKDSILDLVLSSIPEETKTYGTDTPLQLTQKFDALKGTLRHFSLIPPGGGGFFAHSLARVAALLRVREGDQSGEGIESVITRVESFLLDGKLAEAADALEEGVKGSHAADFVGDWARLARNRAIAEQALTILQSYATTFTQVS